MFSYLEWWEQFYLRINERKLTNEEFIFYKSFDVVIEGKNISDINFEKIKEYVMCNHGKEINELKKFYLTDERKTF